MTETVRTRASQWVQHVAAHMFLHERGPYVGDLQALCQMVDDAGVQGLGVWNGGVANLVAVSRSASAAASRETPR